MVSGSSGGIKYSDFVDYSKLDPVKRLALNLFEPTLGYPESRDIRFIPETLGEASPAFDFSELIKKGVEFLLVPNVEGLGTKNKIADAMYKEATENGTISEKRAHELYSGLGQDTMAMSVNDSLSIGADVFAYCDIITCGNSKWFDDRGRIEALLKGYRTAADIGKIAIPQGETPELRGIVYPDTLDLAGSSLGIIIPKERLVTGKKIAKNDFIIGLESSGIHSNGLTKARAICSKLKDGFFTQVENRKTIGEQLLTPTTIYSQLILPLFDFADIHYLQPITGHGWEKICRYRGRPFTYFIEELPEPNKVFENLIELGKDYNKAVQKKDQFDLSERENYYTWNMGIGYVIIVPDKDVDEVMETIEKKGVATCLLGYVDEGPRQVVMPFEEDGKTVIYVP